MLSAARQASDYAPELTIIGTAAIAPVVDVSRFASRVTTYFGFTFVTLGAWSEIYGIDPSAIFAERSLAQLQRLDSECASTYLFDWFMLRREDAVIADPLMTPPWRELLDAQNIEAPPALPGPVLLIQGSNDPIVSPEATEALARGSCSLGGHVELVLLSGVGHGVPLSGASRVLPWFEDRAAGRVSNVACA